MQTFKRAFSRNLPYGPFTVFIFLPLNRLMNNCEVVTASAYVTWLNLAVPYRITYIFCFFHYLPQWSNRLLPLLAFLATMNKARGLMKRRVSYEALEDVSTGPDGEIPQHSWTRRFSWIEYVIFMLLGIEMLWAWCAPSESPAESMIAEPL